MSAIEVFDYVEELDAFLVRPEFTTLSERLGLTEWTPVVWIGRLFFLDNDYSEHWFDNWDEREALEACAAELGINGYDLMIVVPDRFQNGKGGPRNTDSMRKAFWADVLKSLTLSYELLFEQARRNNQQMKELNEKYPNFPPDMFLPDLEERIAGITIANV